MNRLTIFASAILAVLFAATSAVGADTITITKTTKKSVPLMGVTYHWIEVEGTYTGDFTLNQVRTQRIVGDPPAWQDWYQAGGTITFNSGNGTFICSTAYGITAVTVTIRVQGYRGGAVVSTSAEVTVNYP
jgi:hypothetical protein